MATDEEIQHLRKLRATHEDRRRVLELQIAAYGNGAPAEKVMDLEDANEAIARIDAKLFLPSIPDDVQAATGPEANIDVLRLEVKRFREQLHDALRWMTNEILAMREESQTYRSKNDTSRLRGQRANFTILLIIAILVAYQVFFR